METVHELQVKNRSYRRFRKDPVPREILEYAIGNAQISSSAMNQQVLRYRAVVSRERVQAMQPLVHWAAMLPHDIGAPRQEEEPPVFIVITMQKDNRVTEIDLGIAVHALTLSLCEQSIGSCIMDNVRRDAVASLLQIPPEEHIGLVVAAGKPVGTSRIVPGTPASLAYYADEERNLYVPKLDLDEVLQFC